MVGDRRMWLAWAIGIAFVFAAFGTVALVFQLLR
jgi:hypothetical protein